ncbi:ATP-dependent RNA helicase RhlB [Deinococcus aluminii]|uniref:ATP-dependent RNA helicase RhlB n=1 Tax=Deinococcus aluminii TaxID=1656885 RepID=A0ABP9XHK1_9DEIO
MLVLAPTRALVGQIAGEWQERLPGHCVEAYTSERRNRRPYRQTDIIVTTPERLDLLTRSWKRHWRWLAQVTLLVCDEIHTIADPVRGAALDAALTRVRLLNPLLRVLGLTGTCGNPEQLSAWLSGPHLTSTRRPVPLEWQAYPTRDKFKTLLGVLDARPTLVFVHSRARARDLSKQLQQAGISAAAHHAGLTAEERLLTEQRYQQGEIKVLIATPTLEVGVNFPVEHVVLYDLTFYGARKSALSVGAAWQRAGRAGRRPGLTYASVSVIGSPQEEPHRYLTPDFEALHSPLGQGQHLESFLLGSISGGLAIHPSQLQRLCDRTFAAAQGRVSVRETLLELRHLDAVEEDGARLRVRPLGRVASQALLQVRDVARARLLPEAPTAFDVLLLVAGVLETPRLTPEGAVLVEAQTLLVPSSLLDAREYIRQEDLLTACVLWEACHAGDEDAADAFGLYRPDVTALREQAARLVHAWAQWRPDPKLRLTAVMLASGLPLEHATLTMLSGVGSATARKLARTGLADVEAVATALPEDLVGAGIGIRRAQALITQAEALVKTFGHDLTREVPGCPETRSDFPLDLQGERIDAARLARACTLHVEVREMGFTVTGGNAPHHVTRELRCDCPDFLPARPCKHVLAVRLSQGDPVACHNAALIAPEA